MSYTTDYKADYGWKGGAIKVKLSSEPLFFQEANILKEFLLEVVKKGGILRELQSLVIKV